MNITYYTYMSYIYTHIYINTHIYLYIFYIYIYHDPYDLLENVYLQILSSVLNTSLVFLKARKNSILVSLCPCHSKLLIDIVHESCRCSC